MTCKTQGKYAKKHPFGSTPDASIVKHIEKRLENGCLSCADASTIASSAKVPMEAIGKTADLMEVRIVKCWMGLFGFDTQGGEKRRVAPAKAVSDELKKDIRDNLADGRLTCKDAWNISVKFSITKQQVAEACEALSIKISKCRLGAF